MSGVSLRPYTPELSGEWDKFVRRSKNGTFLFMRGYMDYHAARFPDSSLMIYEDDALVALLPATRQGAVLSSHAGLTYGGFVMADHSAPGAPIRWLDAVAQYCRREGITHIIYKAIPYIYHRRPAQEDLYALWRAGARLSVRNLSMCMALDGSRFNDRLGRAARRAAERWGIRVERERDCGEAYRLIAANLMERHGAVPVHTEAELRLLQSRFPDNILVFAARDIAGSLLGAAVIYAAGPVLHLQYTGANAGGRRCQATDVIYNRVLTDFCGGIRYFDMGTCNENAGLTLNEGLAGHKMHLGCSPVVYDTYELSL
ncbi:MAG: GNAT family N-acetyltransferase [Muribaculaceae bacterium]|nr:GNAT family N-acetyltransferase [Muribaculaceae bacterium]